MPIPAFTTVIVLDSEHWYEWLLAQQTWQRWRPEMWANPMIVFVDAAPPPRGEAPQWWGRKIRRACDHPDLQVIGWPDIPGSLSHRHRMLSAFVYGAAEHVRTEWMLKLDTDTLALKPPASGWTHPNWWREKDPWAFVTASWGYTKSQAMWQRLLKWGATVRAFDGRPEAPGVEDPAKDHVRHARIISFVFHVRMEFIRECAALHPGPFMPIESQDTWLWYCAVRLGRPWAGVRIKKFGWHHGSRGMEKRVKQILEAT